MALTQKPQNALIIGGLLYTKLAALLVFFNFMEPDARFVFNVCLGVAGIITGLVLKAAERLPG